MGSENVVDGIIHMILLPPPLIDKGRMVAGLHATLICAIPTLLVVHPKEEEINSRKILFPILPPIHIRIILILIIIMMIILEKKGNVQLLKRRRILGICIRIIIMTINGIHILLKSNLHPPVNIILPIRAIMMLTILLPLHHHHHHRRRYVLQLSMILQRGMKLIKVEHFVDL